MRTLASRFFATLLVAAGFSPLLHAASYIVPPDGETIRAARAIVIATGLSSYSVGGDDGRMTYTVYQLHINEVLKGGLRVTDTIEVKQPGGCLGTRCVSFPGMPEYKPGERALVFLESDSRGNWSTWSGALGKFSFVHDVHGQRILVRGGTDGEVFGWDAVGNAHIEPLRGEERFLAYVRAIASGERAVEDYIIPRAEVAFPRSLRSNTNSGGFHASNYASSPPVRWKCIFDQPAGSMAGCGGNSSVTFTLFGTASGGVNGSTAANAGMSAWNGDSLSNVSYVVGGSAAAASWNRNDSASSIHFDDDADVVAGCGSQAVGCGGATFDPTQHTFDGSGFGEIVAGDVAIKAGFTSSQTFYNQIVCHELGHTLGFRHSDQGTPSTTNAIMVSTANSGSPFGAVLKSWDQDAVSTAYNPSPAGSCTPPSITTQPPASKTITSGQPANVTIAAAGTSPLTFQWYFGNRGDTSSAVTGQTSATLTHAPTATTMYWVRVTGQCAPAADSNNVTVNVNPATCTPPSITNQPQNQTITQGGSTFLTVGVSGTGPFTFQWFIGTPPNTSASTGTNSNSISVQPGTTTSYWVRVIGQCDPAALSNAALVTVNPSSCPDVVVGAPTATKQSNGSFLLDVTASSGTRPLTYQWFQGTVAGIGTFIGEGKTIVVPAPAAPVSYWARAVNDCQKSANSLGVVTIAPCDLPVIGTQPLDQTIASGASATLSVAVTSPTTPTIRWYRGVAPDKTTEVGTGPSFSTGALTATTQFWASITNTCGEIATQTATVTVSGPACDKPAILTLSPASPSATKGQTVTLVVTASGSETRHYEWYQGASGDTSKKVGTDSSTFTSGPLSAPTQFWVKVTNSCGDASSGTINVEVLIPKLHSVRH
jgi:hypothetical protein